MARLEPLQAPYEPEIADTLRRLIGGVEQEPLKLFRTIAHHPQLLERQALLVRAVDELHDTSTLTDETFAALRERYDEAELVEIVCLVGFYHLVSFVCGAFAVDPELWARSPER